METIEEAMPDLSTVKGVAEVLVDTSGAEIKGDVKTVSIRLPLDVYFALKAMSEHSNCSMNIVVNFLLRAAVNEALPTFQEAGVDLYAELKDVAASGLERLKAEGKIS